MRNCYTFLRTHTCIPAVRPRVGAGLQPFPQLGDTPPQFPGLGVAGGHLTLHPHLGVYQHTGHTLQEGQVCGMQLEPWRKEEPIILHTPVYLGLLDQRLQKLIPRSRSRVQVSCDYLDRIVVSLVPRPRGKIRFFRAPGNEARLLYTSYMLHYIHITCLTHGNNNSYSIIIKNINNHT